jgi:hypothetical protein
MQEHEYALLGGMNRAMIGRYLSIIAASISAIIVFLFLSLIDLAKRFGLSITLTPAILSLVGAGVVFTVLYALFNRYAWRWAPMARWLKVPDLSGTWSCEGKTLNHDGTLRQAWEGEVTIVQSWDKLRIHLKTAESGSDSISAALMCDEATGYHLLYHYRNHPRIAAPNLAAHRGFAELVFSKDLRSVKGEYFNGQGRFTFGTMELRRVRKRHA